MTIRNPQAAGHFYPAVKQMLQRKIEKYISKDIERLTAIGVVSPHAGYIYSGAVAGAVLSAVEIRKTCVVMGPNHTGEGKPFSIMTRGVWKMPLGDCQIDKELAGLILDNSEYLKEDEAAHRYEHSIEVQIPFLQVLRSGISIVPMVLTDAGIEVYRNIGKGLAAAIKGREDVLIIASSDLTHYESYDEAVKKDKKAIEAILNLDEAGLLKAIREDNISMCGYAPVCVMLAAAKELGAKGAKLIKYQTSAEASGDYSSVVGYGGIVVY